MRAPRLGDGAAYTHSTSTQWRAIGLFLLSYLLIPHQNEVRLVAVAITSYAMTANFFLGGIVTDEPHDLVCRDPLGPMSDAGSSKEPACSGEGTTLSSRKTVCMGDFSS